MKRLIDSFGPDTSSGNSKSKGNSNGEVHGVVKTKNTSLTVPPHGCSSRVGGLSYVNPSQVLRSIGKVD